MEARGAMDEAIARTKWCPWVRAIGNMDCDDSANRWPDEDDPISFGNNNLCIASDCMAWRWISVGKEIRTMDQRTQPAPLPTKGYCGLAGRGGGAP